MSGQMELATIGDRASKRIYWHRELPPLNAELIGEHVVEAVSGRVPGSMAHRSRLWDGAYRELMENARIRIGQEIDRLGGRYAHVLDESIDSRRDSSTGEAWLHGRFMYVLYR
jgi:hypothetical protein